MEPYHDPYTDTTVRPRMWRSATNSVVAGVLGGLAERLSISPTLMRWIYSIAAVFTGFLPLVIVYLVLWSITSKHRPPWRDRW